MNANIKNATRREVYRRDGYRCALCDSSQGLQVHHAIARGEGGTDSPQNLITLCSYCHSHAHGHPLYDTPITCLLYTSPSPRDLSTSRMPSSA